MLSFPTNTNQYFSQKHDNYRILSYSLSTISFSHGWGLGEALMPLGGASAAPANLGLAPIKLNIIKSNYYSYKHNAGALPRANLK